MAPVIRIAISILYCHLISSPCCCGRAGSGAKAEPQRRHVIAASGICSAQQGQRLLDSISVPGIAGTVPKLKHITAKRGKKRGLQPIRCARCPIRQLALISGPNVRARGCDQAAMTK
jgi:hypothetical protein